MIRLDTIESITQSRVDLESRGIDTSRPGYRTSGFLIGSVALDMGMDVTQLDIDHWVMNQGILRAVDNLTDDDKLDDLSPHISALEQGDPIAGRVTPSDATAYAQVLDSYSDERKDRQLSLLLGWPTHQEARRKVTSIEEYIDVLRAESGAYTEIVSTIKPADKTEQGLTRDAVNKWMSGFMLTGYYIDTIRDMSDDHKDGSYPMKPSILARLTLAKSACVEGGVETLLKTPKRSYPELVRLIARYGMF